MKTYLDSFIELLLENKTKSYELLKNWHNTLLYYSDNNTKIQFNKNQQYKYNDDKDEEELNNLCNLFKNEINKLIKNHISYNYIKNDCIKNLKNKLLVDELNDNDLKILNLYWLLNNINDELEYYIKQYFENQKEINQIICEWGI